MQTPQKIMFTGMLPKRRQRGNVFKVNRPVVVCVERDISLYSCCPFVDVRLNLFELKVKVDMKAVEGVHTAVSINAIAGMGRGLNDSSYSIPSSRRFLNHILLIDRWMMGCW